MRMPFRIWLACYCLIVFSGSGVAQNKSSAYITLGSGLIRIVVFQNPDLTVETRVSESETVTISTMVPKEQYGRANGMMSLVEAGPQVVAPLLAGALLPLIGLTGVLFFDVATFILAIGAFMIVHIPQPARTEEGAKGQGNILKEAAYGFKYIFARPSLLGLQMTFFAGNLFFGIAFTVMAPMVLAHTNSNSLIFGSVQTSGRLVL